MAHYAFVDENNIVVGVIVGRDEDEVVDGISDWEEYYSSLNPGQRALRTSYNTVGGVHYNQATGEPSEDQSKAFRGNYAGIGFSYNEELDAFIPIKTYPSWVLDESTYSWVAPVPYPEDGMTYTWNESSQSWTIAE